MYELFSHNDGSVEEKYGRNPSAFHALSPFDARRWMQSALPRAFPYVCTAYLTGVLSRWLFCDEHVFWTNSACFENWEQPYALTAFGSILGFMLVFRCGSHSVMRSEERLMLTDP